MSQFLKTAQGVDWLDDFLNKFEKNAVEVVNHEDIYQSLYNQINLVSRTGHRSVAAVTDFYATETGLNEYLQTLSSRASMDNLPSVTDPLPEFNHELKSAIIVFLKNRIKSYHGETSIPALKTELIAMFGGQGLKTEELNTTEMARFINNLIDEERADQSDRVVDHNLGLNNDRDADIDAQNDFFSGLEPVSAQMEDDEEFIPTPEELALLEEEDNFWRKQLEGISDEQLKEMIKDATGSQLDCEKLPTGEIEFYTFNPKGEEVRLGRGENERDALTRAVMYFYQ